MNELKRKMINQARQQYQQIFPCAMHGTLDDCFTEEENRVLFWFNTEDRTTHIIAADVC
jgi:hypothetical protein